MHVKNISQKINKKRNNWKIKFCPRWPRSPLFTKSHYLILSFDRFDIDGWINLYSGSHVSNIPNTVPVWSCIAVGNVPNVIKKLTCRLDTTQYKELLDSHVLPFCNGLQIVHDYFPVHYASSVKEYFKSNQILSTSCLTG